VTAPATPKKVVAPPPATPAELRERVKNLVNDTISRHGGYIAFSENEGSQRAALGRYLHEMKSRDGAGRLPTEPDAAGVENEVRKLLAGMPPLTVVAVPRDAKRRTLPAEVPSIAEMALTHDDLRGIVDVRIQLGDPGVSLARVIDELKKARRLIVPVRATRGPSEVVLHAEAYWLFADLALPRVALKAPSLKDALAEAGLSLQAVKADPPAQQDLSRLEQLFGEMNARFTDYSRVVGLVRDSVLPKRRLAFFRDRVEAFGDVTEAGLLGAKASP
jgi:hypothetical protein